MDGTVGNRKGLASARMQQLVDLAAVGAARLRTGTEALAGAGTGAMRIADIGCDHGFVSLELIREGIAEHVIASDLRKGPLERAKEHIAQAGLSDRIETRLAGGFSGLASGECDGCVIAGMGGALMERILTEGEETAKQMRFLVLQPQSELAHFRRFLKENGYVLLRSEVLCEEGKWYFPMLVTPLPSAEEAEQAMRRQSRYGDLCFSYGEDLLEEDRGLQEYLKWERTELAGLQESLKKLADPPLERIRELEQALELNQKAAGAPEDGI